MELPTFYSEKNYRRYHTKKIFRNIFASIQRTNTQKKPKLPKSQKNSGEMYFFDKKFFSFLLREAFVIFVWEKVFWNNIKLSFKLKTIIRKTY